MRAFFFCLLLLTKRPYGDIFGVEYTGQRRAEEEERLQMIQVTLCEDDGSLVEVYKDYARRFQKEKGELLTWRFLSNPKEMIPEELSREDILILDIEIGELNGIGLAREIRKYNEQSLIIFTTNYLEYALQGYEVAAFRYLKKPISFEEFSGVLLEAIAKHQKSARAVIALRCGYDTEQLRIADIMYCETERGHLRIRTQDGREVLANAGISQVEEELQSYSFFRCHKACLVNLAYVQKPLKCDVLMKDGVTLPVSKYRMKDFMMKLMEYWGGLLR